MSAQAQEKMQMLDPELFPVAVERRSTSSQMLVATRWVQAADRCLLCEADISPVTTYVSGFVSVCG